MNSIYAPCHCNSGKKLKFCCYELTRSGSEIERAQAVAQLPIHLCMQNSDFAESGLASVLITRKIADDRFVVGIYLLDVWCLGLKNVELFKNASLDTIHELIMKMTKMHSNIEPTSYEDARGLILGAIEYARQFAFEPHPDWSYAQYFVEPHRAYTTNIEFGREGKPFYINGPYDKNVPEIMNKVTRAGGHCMTQFE